MKNKEKREVYFFSRLAKALYEDVEALDALHYCHSFSDILTTLQYYGYLKEMTLVYSRSCFRPPYFQPRVGCTLRQPARSDAA
ncbi:hypothetical protein [Schwartzia sp. (in: firmicutes)]